MSSNVRLTRNPTSPAHDYFDLMFQGTDMISSFWQPYFKSAGRWQLEVAQLAAKQTRAAIELGNHLARSSKPDDISDAFRTYWGNLHASYETATRNIGTALVKAAPEAIVLAIPPRRRPHDTLELLGLEAEDLSQRKVA